VNPEISSSTPPRLLNFEFGLVRPPSRAVEVWDHVPDFPRSTPALAYTLYPTFGCTRTRPHSL